YGHPDVVAVVEAAVVGRALLGVGVAAVDAENPGAGVVGDPVGAAGGRAVAPADGGAVVAGGLGPARVGEGGHHLAGRQRPLGGADLLAAGDLHGRVGDGGLGRGGGVVGAGALVGHRHHHVVGAVA